MRCALIGSKSLGLRALGVMREHGEVTSVITADDRGDARSRLASFEHEGASVVATRRDADRAIAAIDAEVVVVAGWYWIVRSDELAKRRFVGIHHSLLPQYRGGSPLVWAMIEGQTEVGTSIFTLTERADEGPIWAQSGIPVQDGDYISDVVARCDTEGLRLLPVVFDPAAVATNQDHERATWRPQRRPADGEIDWSRPAEEVVRWIRAQSRPYPGAFARSHHQRIMIWRAYALNEPMLGRPGDVSGSTVVCGNGLGVFIEESDIPLQSGTNLYESSSMATMSS